MGADEFLTLLKERATHSDGPVSPPLTNDDSTRKEGYDPFEGEHAEDDSEWPGNRGGT